MDTLYVALIVAVIAALLGYFVSSGLGIIVGLIAVVILLAALFGHGRTGRPPRV